MNGTPWTRAQIALLRKLYPDTPTRDVAQACGHSMSSTYTHAKMCGIKKSAAFLASPASGIIIKGSQRGAAFRFPKGHVPYNKGLRRPGWHAGRMRETQFKKGQFSYNHDPDYYVIGALRVNTDGYIDMRVSFEPGANGWRALHRILWEDAHGPVPAKHILRFRDGDKLNVCLENLELITLAENARRNSIHNLPAPLKSAIQLLGALKRTINRRTRDGEHRRSAHPSVSNPQGPARQEQPHGPRPRQSRRRHRASHR